MDKSRFSYQIKRGAPLGDRLIWRQPCASAEIRKRLAPAIVAAGRGEPNSITIGYYRQWDQPPGAWCFMPLNTPLALAALGVESVRDRICEDLADYIARTPEHVYCERCERAVVPREDKGDQLCPACGLVL